MPPLTGKRDVLIDIFERNFIESQEALGTRVAASFRNLDDPNRFVWIRGFETMETRFQALDGFYSGPLWQSQRSQRHHDRFRRCAAVEACERHCLGAGRSAPQRPQVSSFA